MKKKKEKEDSEERFCQVSEICADALLLLLTLHLVGVVGVADHDEEVSTKIESTECHCHQCQNYQDQLLVVVDYQCESLSQLHHEGKKKSQTLLAWWRESP